MDAQILALILAVCAGPNVQKCNQYFHKCFDEKALIEKQRVDECTTEATKTIVAKNDCLEKSGGSQKFGMDFFHACVKEQP